MQPTEPDFPDHQTYAPPALTMLGTIAELTAGANVGTDDLNGAGSTGDMSDLSPVAP